MVRVTLSRAGLVKLLRKPKRKGLKRRARVSARSPVRLGDIASTLRKLLSIGPLSDPDVPLSSIGSQQSLVTPTGQHAVHRDQIGQTFVVFSRSNRLDVTCEFGR